MCTHFDKGAFASGEDREAEHQIGGFHATATDEDLSSGVTTTGKGMAPCTYTVGKGICLRQGS